MGRIRDSSTFAAGQRSEIGRYEVPTEVSLPGFGIGMINEDFHRRNRTGRDCEVEEGGDVFDGSRFEILQVEDAELVLTNEHNRTHMIHMNK